MVSRKRTSEQNFAWDVATTPEEIGSALKELSKRYPALKGGRGAAKLEFVREPAENECRVESGEGKYVIHYSRANMALRMVGNLLAGIVPDETEYCPFETFGIMLDCSRNAVMTVDHIKEYLCRMALFGYNMVMLYTEDTYEIEDEPLFGCMRGALTQKEIREIDGHCEKLGMELIPCIQALGHLEQIARWGHFGEVMDTGRVLLVDEPKTYELIDKMLKTWKNAVRSRRIHLGMDETHDIGRGKFYDRHGDERHFDIFNRHFQKVTQLCRENGLEPMIWSDMYFRMGSKTGGYYDRECEIPQDVIRQIPADAGLVYWDYYHEDRDFYEEWIRRHRALNHEPIMGSGVWTWGKFWYDRTRTEKTVIPCLEACRKTKVKEVFFTMWGDDGEYCDYDSAFAGLGFASELSYTGAVSAEHLEKKFAALLDGASYRATMTASELEQVTPSNVLWDDPLMLRFLGSAKLREKNQKNEHWYSENYARAESVADAMGRIRVKSDAGGDIKYARLLADAVLAKFRLTDALLGGYQRKDRTVLKQVPALLSDYGKKLELFTAEFEAMWKRHNKPFGLETMQIRFAGQIARVKEAEKRIKLYLAGKEKTIPELDQLIRTKGDYYIYGYALVSHGSSIL